MTAYAGSVTTLFKGDTTSLESSVSKAAATVEREMARTERANKRAGAEADKFVASLKRQVDTFGLSGPALLRYEAGLKGIGDKAEPLIKKLEELKRVASQPVGANYGEAANGMHKVADGAERVGFHTTRARTELVVLGHELSQGNYSKFGGSLMVLAESTNVAHLAFSRAGLAVLGGVGTLGLFAFAAIKGAVEANNLGKALAATGNFAGQTAGSFDTMARSIAGSTGQHIGAARDAIMGLVESGQIGPRVLKPLGEAVTLYAMPKS